ncbi:hypothetical protein, partial [Labrys sp. 22185]|uniref:hypothetical protein n=1 Tax=Labrys sp. 22185 TaxID=3453888 RepID=UPI003F850583
SMDGSPGASDLSGFPADLGANIYPASPGCWRAQMGNPHGVSLNNWAASKSHYKSQVPHAPITSAGTLL